MTHDHHDTARPAFHRGAMAAKPPMTSRTKALHAPSREDDLYLDHPDFKKHVRDAVEVDRVEAVRPPFVGRFAFDEAVRGTEKRRFVLSIGARFGMPRSAREFHDAVLFHWTPEIAIKFGRPPSLNTVRRWLRVHGEVDFGGDCAVPPENPLAKAAIERAFIAIGHCRRQAPLEKRRSASWAMRRSARRVTAFASSGPAVGEIVQVDGVARRYLGRTAGGRVAYCDPVAPAGGGRPPVNTSPATHTLD